MSTHLSVAGLNECLSGFRHLRCWRLGRYLGSMLTMDFGAHIYVETHDSTVVAEGELSIGIRNVFWAAVADGDRMVTNAADVDDDLFKKKLIQSIVGASLAGISSPEKGGWVNFQFDNGFTLSVDAANMWQTSGDIFEIKVPDGKIIVLDREGVIELLEEVEPLRAERWRLQLL